LTPEIPEDCPEKLAQLMKMCWNKDPNQRPVSSLSLISHKTRKQALHTLLFISQIFFYLKKTKSFETICQILDE
jgi:hypothetical protein